jgi:PAS domain S-box-containing protein
MFNTLHRAYQLFFSENPLPMWIYDAKNLQFLASNEAGVRKFGYSENEFILKPMLDLCVPDERTQFLNALHSSNVANNSFFECKFQSKTTQIIAVRLYNYSLDTQNPTIKILLAQDISCLAKTIEELQVYTTNFEAVFDTSIQIKYLFDTNYTILKANRKAFESARLAFEQEIELNQSILKYIKDEENRIGFMADFEEARKGNKIQYELKFNTVNQQTLWYEINHLPIFNQQGKVERILLSMLDVTERKKNELKMAQQIRDLQEFAFITSHELRRPLANILGLTSIFNKKNFADEFNAKIINHLETTAIELDLIIHKMNDLLAEKKLLANDEDEQEITN